MGRIVLEAIVLLYFAMLVNAKMKSVSINLKAKWSSTPFLAETSEYFFNKSGEAFWSFVDATTSLDVGADNYDEYSDYMTAVDVSSKFLTPSKLRLLKFALSTRYYSPAVQMHQEMARDRMPPGSCKAFVEVNNFVTCEVAAFKAYLKTLQRSDTLVLNNERIYPSRHESPVHVVLYARLGTEDFRKWHRTLAELSDEGKLTYIFRHYFKLQNEASTKCFLSGYGVELAIKSTEYKAKDDTKVAGDRAKDEEASVDEVQGFVFSTLKSLYPDSTKDLQEFRQFLVDSTGDMAPLKVWQMQDLSFQAAQKVMLEPKENQLNLLKDLSQNFPSLARRLVKVAVSDGLKKGIRDNQRYLEQQHQLSPGDTAFFINGVRMDGDMFEVFSVLERIDAESDLIEGLSALGSRFDLESQQLSPLLTLELKGEDVQFGLDIRDPSVWYINDLEHDQAYMSWPGSVSDLLRPTFPGMLRHIRKNLFNLVLVINPVDPKQLSLVKTVEAFYSYQAPIRVGLMFVVPEDTPDRNASVALVKAFSHIYHEDSPGDAIAFLAHDVSALSVKGIDTDSVRSLLSVKFSRSTVEDMMSGEGSDDDDDEKYNLKRSMDFYQRSGLSTLPQLLLNGVPLTQQEVEGELEDAIYQKVLRQTSDLQRFVYNGALTDKEKVIDFLMTQKNIMPRLNQRVLQVSNRYLNLARMHSASSSIFSSSDLTSLNEASLISVLSSDLKHLVKNEESKLRPLTVWVVCDLEKPEGRSLFLSALKHLKHTNNMRLGLIHNVPHSSVQSKGRRISSVVQHAIENLSLTTAKNFLFKILREENVPQVTASFKNLAEFSVGNMDMESFIEGLEKRGTELFDLHKVFCQKVLKLPSSAHAVVANGKVIGPLDENSVFVEKDFELIERVSQAAFVEKVEKIVKSYKLEGEVTSDLVMRLESVLMSQNHRENRIQLKFVEMEHSVLHIKAPEPGPTFDLVAVLDPVSRGAQKFLPIIEALSEVVNADIKIFFNCREKLSEMPLKSFYRFVLNPEPQIKDDALVAPSAQFYGLPENSLLTLNMDTPESWLVEAVHSPYDLDNILLSEVESRVAAEFELEKLLLEGRCYDLISGNPPRGLQFILGTNSTPALVDTIVMANLGYFQLKASPGLWYLRLREGKSRDLYNIVGQGAADVKDSIMVLMDSFKGVTIYPKVTKKEGMEKEDLLSDTESSYGIWDSLSSTLGGRTSRDSEEDSTINIFSLASGHLYERFLRIMMLSVLKNTQSKVKFWFLKNYLSPSFKNFIPHMASKYNFEYELVQYKWPRWLHQQTEKQRMIWGYKILFLDVLFPLSVNKIIFVDADQTVRADLKELHDLDLEGAPYGYTPFCDSREDMDGYRFWKSGYWQSHLGHRKYHISALYVVDLKKFRRIAAGDRLRGQYQGLSQDPNSLSNLDQDLPNNMIHQVAIKSLPQEWLWCETWCSDAEKKKAKTIDLCNNPKTKEPKLEAAMRIVAEWKDYDGEVKSLWDKVNNVSDETATIHAPDSAKLPHGEL